MMLLDWSGTESSTLWASVESDDRGQIRLVVETLPDGGWDWVVWRAGRGKASLSGCAPSRESGIDAAEAAAAYLAAVTI